MARPKAETPTCVPYLRGNALSVRLSFAGLKYRTPKIDNVEPEFIMKNGYVKPSHENYLDLNERLGSAIQRLEQAFRIAQAAGELTEQRLGVEYKRLTGEAEQAARHAQKRAEVEEQVTGFRRRLRTERAINQSVHNEDVEDQIQRLHEQLKQLNVRRDNQRREAGTYDDDKLITFLEKYATRDGIATMADATRRSHSSFIETVRQFESATTVQEVDEEWMVRFQDWLISTPSNKPIYQTIPNPAYAPGNGQKQKMRGKILYYKTGDTRKNDTIQTYLQKVTSCLNYYQARPSKLPKGVTINDSFKLYKFKLKPKEDNVVALEEHELFQLLDFTDFAMREQERARDILLFLSATSLRHSDLVKVTPSAVKNGIINLTAQKTSHHSIEVNIPLNVISTAILKKYAYNMVNCKLSYHKVNRRIREVLNHNGGKTFPSLQEPVEVVNYSGARPVGKTSTRANEIGTHSGRRTFINICLDYNVPVNKIIGMTGHLNVATLMIYANKRKDVKKHMSNIFQLPAYPAQDYGVVELAEVVQEV
ncbi:tyrosine-type recombinase/integrase [Hymenobacter setariae]|uniref:Tyrosine-type recombinase/integrase n=1 Tax=Hymenobacter setariae TaxID=2594794 RepID=A0A558BRX1_9BACT|nr:tyrosine-type recombinase/integrase [Hymenobacter setariae]TVT39260.1 tyrosine-type recombinase/integrase [Hymenobacter setariae]